MQQVPISSFLVGPEQPLLLMSGPCVIESLDHTLCCAERLQKISSSRSINLVFKASYDKANRSSINGFRGPGIEEGLRILEKVRTEFNLPIITDIHTPQEATVAGEVCDVLQIPAFLCRQTDLIVAAAKTGCTLNIKKGQFMAPWDMENVVDKVRESGNSSVMLCDRGTSFGYNNLVSDMRAIPAMQQFGCPVVFDASHSVQLPGGLGTASGGQREYIPTLARAAVAAGCNGLFIETHTDPANAKSDAASVLCLEQLPGLLDILERLYDVVQCTCPSTA
ncbi:2-dehydro-3-deoxyphosphooctonate aldolase [Chlamydiales bacterium SCGC AG-110-P3]|nr:2-dehydro-3-deoxyphosphooctonate aldolase [Chlamydiales bacterium SCGC AG-110-P3]